jgi:hypothetical protein
MYDLLLWGKRVACRPVSFLCAKPEKLREDAPHSKALRAK